MVGPALVSQQGGNISAQFKRTVKEGGIQFETSLVALICSTTCLRALRIFKLRRFHEKRYRQETSVFTYHWEDIWCFMRHIVQLFTILSAPRVARDNIFRNPFKFFEGEADDSLESNK